MKLYTPFKIKNDSITNKNFKTIYILKETNDNTIIVNFYYYDNFDKVREFRNYSMDKPKTEDINSNFNKYDIELIKYIIKDTFTSNIWR